jgi:hypothetical protein
VSPFFSAFFSPKTGAEYSFTWPRFDNVAIGKIRVKTASINHDELGKKEKTRSREGETTETKKKRSKRRHGNFTRHRRDEIILSCCSRSEPVVLDRMMGMVIYRAT